MQLTLAGGVAPIGHRECHAAAPAEVSEVEHDASDQSREVKGRVEGDASRRWR